MVIVQEYIIDTAVKVTFELTYDEHIYYRYVRGLLTREEAEIELSSPWDMSDELRMVKLVKRLS